MRIKEWLHWAAGYGLGRVALKLFAYRGDPFSRLLIDTSQADNIYPLIEQVRHQYGRISLVEKVAWVTADAQIVREVLRDDRFRTAKPRRIWSRSSNHRTVPTQPRNSNDRGGTP